VDKRSIPDFTALDAATDMIGGAVRSGTLVSYETTLPVHTTRQRFAPALERRSGLRCGHDLYLCHSPERVFSGRIFADLRRYPKLVGGVDEASATRAIAFYQHALEFDDRPDLDRPNGVWDLGSAEAAELAKLAETTYRDLNIAFANELAVAADRIGIDVHAVIRASNSQPYSHIHAPGIAVGGHCIPVYPHFLLSSVEGLRLPAVAREINSSMPGHAVQMLEHVLTDLNGLRSAVLGLAYRGGVKEHAFSGAFALVDELRSRGATPLVHDPLYDDDELRSLGFTPFHLGDPAHAAIVQADHAEYEKISPADVAGASVVYDGRGVLDAAAWDGVRLLRLGAGR
jgi:UDP-N-acetyl-D-glucosamine dehydrogenase